MHVRASVPLSDDFFLLTIGSSARYVAVPEGGAITIIDPGCSIHVTPLLQRLAQFKIPIDKISFVALTHCDADRITAAAALKALNPKIQIVGSASIADAVRERRIQLLKDDKEIRALFPHIKCETQIEPELLEVDKILVEGSVLQLSEEVALRMISAPGHTAISCAYALEPHGYVVGDEVLGYYRGREAAGPGSDFDIEAGAKSLQTLIDHGVSALCLPYGGVLTGELVPKHLSALRITMQGLVAEVARAKVSGIDTTEIAAQIQRGLYAVEDRDPLLRRAIQKSQAALLKQLTN